MARINALLFFFDHMNFIAFGLMQTRNKQIDGML